MGRRYKNLFQKIIDIDNLWDAYRKAAKGNVYSYGHLAFKQNEASNLTKLRESLINDTYRIGKPICFLIRDPKTRLIHAAPFVDRVVQHAINNIIEPIFDRTFARQSFACRKGKGTHKAAIIAQSLIRKPHSAFVLKTDFRKYFPSVDMEILHKEIRRKISCQKTIGLISKFAPKTGTGLPIGNLLSQLFANVYGNIIDRWLIHKMKIKSFVRYMDDIVVVCRNIEIAKLLQVIMSAFARTNMKLEFSRWQIRSVKHGVNFCGYRIFEKYKLIRKNSVKRAKRKLKIYDEEKLKKFIPSWRGHAMWANTHNLLTKLGISNEQILSSNNSRTYQYK